MSQPAGTWGDALGRPYADEATEYQGERLPQYLVVSMLFLSSVLSMTSG
jgi:hypothetical protein